MANKTKIGENRRQTKKHIKNLALGKGAHRARILKSYLEILSSNTEVDESTNNNDSHTKPLLFSLFDSGENGEDIKTHVKNGNIFNYVYKNGISEISDLQDKYIVMDGRASKAKKPIRVYYNEKIYNDEGTEIKYIAHAFGEIIPLKNVKSIALYPNGAVSNTVFLTGLKILNSEDLNDIWDPSIYVDSVSLF